jgi:DNA-binding XRE family transcriptional regulator
LSQEALAEKADISRTFMQGIERGEENPTLKIILGLKRGLNCSWNDLFEDVS